MEVYMLKGLIAVIVFVLAIAASIYMGFRDANSRTISDN